LAVAAVEPIPARFAATPVYDEEFVIAARCGHPFLMASTLKRYCEAMHVLVSVSGDAHGFVDDALQRKGLSRRVALTVPSFMLALAALERTDMLAAVPLSLARTHAARFGLSWVPAPLPLLNYPLQTVTSRAAMQDAGVAWLFETLVAVARAASVSAAPEPPPAKRARARPRAKARSSHARAQRSRQTTRS
jgi:DNA-binding transcriptional LysR family regulator